MEETDSPKRSAKRVAKRQTGREPAKGLVKTIGLEEDAFSQLEANAKKLRMSKTKFASAAVTYFTEKGLDPTKAGVSELAQLRTQIGESAYEVRKQNADIGNRLVAIIRTWEANQYKFMQTQHVGVVGYLEDIEANILNHQVAVESQLLAPMMERLVRTGVETHMTRLLNELLLLKFDDDKYPISDADIAFSNGDYNKQLDTQFVGALRKLLETARVTAPVATKKPVLAVPTLGPPPKPATTTTPGSVTPAPPKS
jgi:hypothetical protein